MNNIYKIEKKIDINNIYHIAKRNTPYIWYEPVWFPKDYYRFKVYRINYKVAREHLLQFLNKKFFVLLLKGHKFSFDKDCLFLDNKSFLCAYVEKILTIDDIERIDNIIEENVDESFFEICDEYGGFLSGQAARSFMIENNLS